MTGRGLRVLHLTSSFPRSEGDHQAAYLGDLVRAQADAGIEPLVLSPHAAGLARADKVGAVPVTRFRYGPRRFEVLAYRGGLLSTARTPAGAAALAPFLAAFAFRATSLARARSVDVIHAHWWLPAGLVALPACRLSGVPLVVTCHGSDVELMARPGAARLARAVLRRATVVGAVSQSLAEAVTRQAGVDARVLRMPLVTGPPLDSLAVPAPPPPPPLRLLAAGRLSPEKGFDVALAAIGLLDAEDVDVELRIVGDGPQREALEAEARHLKGRVVVQGPVSREELGRLMLASHAVVVPSRHEGLGLVALEAVALGTPVIASAVGGLVEVVEAGVDGLLVSPGDPVALAAAIGRLPLLPAAGAAARLHRPEAVVAEHRRAYEDALAGSVLGGHG